MIQQSSLQNKHHPEDTVSKIKTQGPASICMMMEEADLSRAEKASNDSGRHATINTTRRGRGTSSFLNGVVRGRSHASEVAWERRVRVGFWRNERVQTPEELKHRRRKLEVEVAVAEAVEVSQRRCPRP